MTSPLGLLNGAAKPRVETHPAYAYSYGDVGAELMRAAGRPLDDWQTDSLTLMLAVREDGQWACFECCEWVSRQNGKGGILEARALTGFFLIGEELIMWSAHEYKTAMEAFRRVKALVRALGEKLNENNDNLWVVDGILVKFNNTNGEESLERLDTGARIKFIARTAGSGRGFSGDCNIIDEAFAYTHVQHEALLFTLSARPNPQLIYTSSPPLSGITGDVMYDLRLRGDPTALREPEDGPWRQDPALGYRDWGLPGDLDFLDGVDLDDIANWAATNPALGIRITHETIERERASFRGKPAGFARERLGIWPKRIKVSGGLFTAADWAAQLDPDSEMADPVVLAVSVSWDRAYGSICAAGRRTDGLLHGETVDNRRGTGWMVERLAALVTKWDPREIVVNPGGPAGSLIEDIKANEVIKKWLESRTPHQIREVTARENAQAFGAFCDMVKGETHVDKDTGIIVNPRVFRHIGDDELTAAVFGATSRTVGDGHALEMKVDADMSPLDGVILALHGVRSLDQKIVNPPATAPTAPVETASNMFRPTARLSI